MKDQMGADTKDMNDEKSVKTFAQETKAAAEGDVANAVQYIVGCTRLLEVDGSHCRQVAANRLAANSFSDLVVFGRQAADTTAELVRPFSPLATLPAKPARQTPPLGQDEERQGPPPDGGVATLVAN